VAHRIFGALLRPIGEGEINVGQYEEANEVLGVDTGECAWQYVVSSYMLSPPEARANAVRAAIDEIHGVGVGYWGPIRAMERVAIEPLPALEDFLRSWRTLIASNPADARVRDFDTEDDRWLREVVQRLEGSDGLAKLAQSTRRADDLRAWCRSLVDAGDWNAALPAFEEAARLVPESDYARGELLDGAALAAQVLGRGELPNWLERAWRVAPSMVRLRRWLGSADSGAVLEKRTTEALEALNALETYQAHAAHQTRAECQIHAAHQTRAECQTHEAYPRHSARQLGFLHVLRGDFEAAAKLLAAAPGLGWSDCEHPGHLLFPLFAGLLAANEAAAEPTSEPAAHRGMDLDELKLLASDGDAPKLATPENHQILRTAGVDSIPNAVARSSVLIAMRKAAERRLAGVTEEKRRRHYGHAAELVALCVACDPSPETTQWVLSVKTAHRRFPALRAELERALGSP
jgi:hypothetical protein